MTRTNKYRTLNTLCHIISILVLVLPVLYYIGEALFNHTLNIEQAKRVTLGVCIVISLILVCINVLFKYKIRSTLWIVVLGLAYCLNNIMPLIFMLAIGTIVDEFVLTPLQRSFKAKLVINKEMDKRLGE